MIEIIKIPESLKQAYENSLNIEKIQLSRVFCILGVMLIATSAIVDIWALPSAFMELTMLKVVVITGYLLTFAMTYSPLFIKHYDLINIPMFLMIGFLIIYAIHISKVTDLAYYTYFSYLCLTFMVLYSLSYLKSSTTVVVTALYLGGYVYAVFSRGEQGPHGLTPILVSTLFVLSGSIAIGLIGKIFRDNHLRQRFLLEQELRASYNKKEKEAELYEYDANHDTLTGLPNRRYINTFIEERFERKAQENMVILFLDLNGFKDINDNFGHDAGDETLKVTAQRLRFCISKKDMLVRLGGDEFLIYLTLEKNDQLIIDSIQNRIRESIAKPIIFEENKFRVTTSIGISTSFKDGDQVKKLIALADERMYQDKIRLKRMVA